MFSSVIVCRLAKLVLSWIYFDPDALHRASSYYDHNIHFRATVISKLVISNNQNLEGIHVSSYTRGVFLMSLKEGVKTCIEFYFDSWLQNKITW